MELLPAEDDILPDNEDASNEEEEDDASVSANDEATNNNLFHDEEIEQNQTQSVKVKILRPTDNPSELLDKLVECSDIKRRMDELVGLTHYNKMMHELFPNSKQHEVSLHSVFLGHPGTYSDLLTQAYKIRNSETWGNARFVANQLERIYIQHATRCINQQPKDKKDLLILTPEDISPIEVPRQRTKIGF